MQAVAIISLVAWYAFGWWKMFGAFTCLVDEMTCASNWHRNDKEAVAFLLSALFPITVPITTIILGFAWWADICEY